MSAPCRPLPVGRTARPATAIGVLALLAITGLAACLEPGPGDLEPSAAVPEPETARPRRTGDGATLLPPAPAVSDGRPRGRWEMRLWLGLWCAEHAEGASPATYVVEVDGVPMFESTTTCPPIGAERRGAPNGGSTAFTLAEGPHVVTVVGPAGSRERFPLAVMDDTWLRVEHGLRLENGDPVIAVDPSTRPVPWDVEYDPRTRPVRAGEERSAPASAPSDEAEGTGEWLQVREAAAEADADWAGTEPAPAGRPARERDPGGTWIVGTPAYLRVVSAAPVAVWVDGYDTGMTTPTEPIPMSAGRHRVVLRSEGFERSYSISVPAGRLRTLVNGRTE